MSNISSTKSNHGHLVTFKLSALTAALLLSYPTVAQTAEPATPAVATTDEPVETAEVALERMDVTVNKTNRYQQGKNEQFNNNIVTLYKDKDEVERFKGVNPADLLSGVAGVYSSDARNNGGISPNIRGLQGEGRVPVVVDGTQSEYTVYRGYAGVNNRTYVDPNLISEVKVYKGAVEAGQGVPTGSAGAVILNTIDANDIIPEGKNWGVNVKYETNNNSIKPKLVDIPYGKHFPSDETLAFGLDDITLPLFKYTSPDGKHKFFDDYALRLAVAGKSDVGDLMVAYSKREQGNYFSGTKGAGDYYDSANDDNWNLATYSTPGHEVTNTSNINESVLIKGNWNIADDQKLKLSYRHTDTQYGEIMNSRATYSYFLKKNFNFDNSESIGLQWPLAKIQQNSGRMDYEFKPKDNPLINFDLGAWFTNTHTAGNTSGGSVSGLLIPRFDDNSFVDYQNIMYWYFGIVGTCLMDRATVFDCKPSVDIAKKDWVDQIIKQFIPPEELAELDPADIQEVKDRFGELDPNKDHGPIVNKALILYKQKNFGVDLKNTFEINDKLNLTVGANLLKEKLDGRFGEPALALDYSYNRLGNADYTFPPKVGEREEYKTWVYGDWQATDKLKVNLGGQYSWYRGYDPVTDAKIASGEISWVHSANLRLPAVRISEPVGVRKDDGFAPNIALSYQFTPQTRGYVRYTENIRFPSIYENSYGFSQRMASQLRPQEYYGFKKERAKNFEIGVSQDLTRWLPSLEVADIKLNYYRNQINDVIDREYDSAHLTQYDRLTNTGLELQGRFDTGRYFGTLGYSHLIDSKMCDWSVPEKVTVYVNSQINSDHACFTGGFPGGYLRSAMPPTDSLHAGLGVRLLNDKLTLGSRFAYHSRSKAEKQEKEGFMEMNRGTDAYVWKSYWTADAYVDYAPTPNLKFSLIGTNLTDTYHPDALSRTYVAAPGRTIKLGVDFKF